MTQLRREQLAAHLARGLQRLYTVHGDEALLAGEAADSIRTAARDAGHAERKVHSVLNSGQFDWSALEASAVSQSLFCERTLVEIRIPSGKPGKEGGEALQRYCKRLREGVVTLVQLPRLDLQQTKSAWFAALDSAGVTVRIDTVERRALPQWIAERLALQGQQVQGGSLAAEGQRALAFFADRVEGNLLAAHHEVQKLALLHPPGALSFAQIEASVVHVARYDVYKLGEAVLAGELKRALRMLEGLQAAGEPAARLHWSLAEDIRALLRVKLALREGTPLPLALREARVWGTRERLFEQALPRLPEPALHALLAAAQACDGIVKGLPHPEWPKDPWQALKRLLLMWIGYTGVASQPGRPIALRA